MRPILSTCPLSRSKSAAINQSRDALANHNAGPVFLKACVAVVAISILGGCTMSRGMSLESDREIVTSSISAPVKSAGIDSTDADIIKTVVADAAETTEPTNVLAWSNPDTGNHGTIMAIDRFIGKHGQSCKKFQTTVSSFTGISVYNGEACEMSKGSWVLSWFTQD